MSHPTDRKVLLGSLIMLAGVGIVLTGLACKGGNNPAATTAPPTPAPAQPAPPVRQKPTFKAQTVDFPQWSAFPASQRLSQAVEQFWPRYDAAVASDTAEQWMALAQWCNQAGLYVEARHAARRAMLREHSLAARQMLTSSPQFHCDHFVIHTSYDPLRYTRINNNHLEAALQPLAEASNATWSADMYRSISQAVEAKDTLTPSRVARHVVDLDLPVLRRAFEEYCKDPGFVRMVLSELANRLSRMQMPYQYAQSDADQQSARSQSTALVTTSWYHARPLNLWLLRQLATMDMATLAAQGTSDDKGTKADKPGPGGHPPGMHDAMMMPPPGMSGRSGRRDNSAAAPSGDFGTSPAYASTRVIFMAVNGRGGVVASDLIGNMLAGDYHDKGSLSAAIVNGALDDMNVSARYTGPVADGMIKPLTELLNTVKGNEQQSQRVARMLAARHYDPGSAAVADAVADDKTVGNADVWEELILTGTTYSLQVATALIGRSDLSGAHLRAVSDALLVDMDAGSHGGGLWQSLQRILPRRSDTYANGDSDATGGVGTLQSEPRAQARRKASEGRAINRRSLASAFPGAGAWDSDGSTPAIPSGQPRLPDTRVAVDGLAIDAYASLLLHAAGNAYVSADAASAGGMRPGSTGSTPSGHVLRNDALSCLASLHNAGHADKLLVLLDDEYIRPMVCLALAMADDRQAVPRLLAVFKKDPFALVESQDDQTRRRGDDAVSATIQVPQDAYGLADHGITPREALVLLDDPQAGDAFLEALRLLFTPADRKGAARAVAIGSVQIMQALARWKTTKATTALRELVESTGDFGLAANDRSPTGDLDNPLALRIRREALDVLGQIGPEQALEVLLRQARLGSRTSPVTMTALMALARRGYTGAADVFLDALDPGREPQQAGRSTTPDLNTLSHGRFETIEQLALFGLGQMSLERAHIGRITGLIDTYASADSSGGQRRGSSDAGIQRQLTLILAGSDNPQAQTAVAGLLASHPAGQQGGYWWQSQSQQPQDIDNNLLQIARALTQSIEKVDPQGFVALAEELTSQQAALYTPDAQRGRWSAQEQLMGTGDIYDLVENSFAQSSQQERVSPPAYQRAMPAMGPDGPMPMDYAPMQADRYRHTRRSDNTERPAIHASELILTTLCRTDSPASRQLRERLSGDSTWRYLLMVELYLAGNEDALADMPVGLASDTGSDKGLYVVFDALERLEAATDAGALDVLARIAQLCNSPLVAERAADTAVTLAVAQEALHRAGTIIAKDTNPDAESFWRDIAAAGGCTPTLRDKVCLLLACYDNTDNVRALAETIKSAAATQEPVDGEMVCASLMAMGEHADADADTLIELYTTITNAKASPSAGNAMNPRMMDRPTIRRGDHTRTNRRNRPSRRDEDMLYKDQCPEVYISALAAMGDEQADRLLLRLARDEELSPLVAIACYQHRHPQTDMIVQAMLRGGADIRPLVEYLAAEGTPRAFAMLADMAADSRDGDVRQVVIDGIEQLFDPRRRDSDTPAPMPGTDVVEVLLPVVEACGRSREREDVANLLALLELLQPYAEDTRLQEALSRMARHPDAEVQQAIQSFIRTY